MLLPLCYSIFLFVVVTTAGPVTNSNQSQEEGVNLLAALRQGHRLIRTSTKTSTKTETVMLTRKIEWSICVKLVNVTGACQTRRGGQVEQPVILTFDENDDMDKQIDDFVDFSPTKTLSIETTTVPEEISRPPITLEASRTSEADLSALSGLTNFFNMVIIQVVTEKITSIINTILSTNTIFLMNCTPVPFTAFGLCPSNRNASTS